MVTKYLVTKDMVDSSISSTSENPVQNKVVYSELEKKLNKGGVVGDLNKVPMMKETGTGTGVYELTLSALPEGKQADWSQTTTTEMDFIKNKPFQAIGTGLTVKTIADIPTLTADYQLHFQIFDTLPTASAAYAQTIALVKKSATSDEYYEYACVNKGTTESPSWAWEQIGSVDLQIEQTTTAIKINGTEIQTATDSQIGLMSSADHVTLTGAQAKSNLVTAFQTTTEDTKYPSEKLVKDNLDLKQDVSNLTTTIAVPASASDTKYPSEKSVSTALAGKQDVADKVTSWSATTSDAKYPSEKLVKDSIDTKIAFATGSTSTSFTIGKDANGYFIEE